jgi:hypothetical protein
MEQGPYLQALTMEPAIRIERTTCGLRIPPNPTSGRFGNRRDLTGLERHESHTGRRGDFGPCLGPRFDELPSVRRKGGLFLPISSLAGTRERGLSDSTSCHTTDSHWRNPGESLCRHSPWHESQFDDHMGVAKRANVGFTHGHWNRYVEAQAVRSKYDFPSSMRAPITLTNSSPVALNHTSSLKPFFPLLMFSTLVYLQHLRI